MCDPYGEADCMSGSVTGLATHRGANHVLALWAVTPTEVSGMKNNGSMAQAPVMMEVRKEGSAELVGSEKQQRR